VRLRQVRTSLQPKRPNHSGFKPLSSIQHKFFSTSEARNAICNRNAYCDDIKASDQDEEICQRKQNSCSSIRAQQCKSCAGMPDGHTEVELRFCLVDYFVDPLAADNRASTYGIYGRQCGTEIGFSPSTSVPSIIPPMLLIHLRLNTSPIIRTRERRLRTSKNISSAVSDIGKHKQKIN
jgi:hypothetical protein